MFFPIRTDRRLKHTPWVNYGLIALNVAVFLVTHRQATGLTDWSQVYQLNPAMPRWFQFVSYQFIHANLAHLGGNMLFLYVFGNSVEDRLGKWGYAAFYLAGGILAGFGHALVEPAPVIGASGAVAAVTGTYLVLFPLSGVTIVYWFIFIGTFEVSSFLLILFQIAQDAVMFMGRFGGVAYLAHLSGYGFGAVVGLSLLGVGLLTREPYDLLTLIEHRRRRAQFQTLTRRGYQPWSRHGPAGDHSEELPAEPSPREKQIHELRSRINAALREHQYEQAADQYLRLLDIDPNQVMSQQQQLDIANQLMTRQSHVSAARAYELFLNTYHNDALRAQVALMLGLIYGRYLNRRQRARELLTTALLRLQDRAQIELAKQVLSEITG